MDYLNEEDQYKEILNQEEISKIKDYDLRRIRETYWLKRHKAHMDEYNIPDHEIGAVWDRLKQEEMKAIEAYKKSKAAG